MKRLLHGGALLLSLWGAAACGHGGSDSVEPTSETSASAPLQSKAESSATGPNGAVAPSPCGKSGLADCPLQAWMKANLQTSLKSGDLGRLSEALERLAHAEPPGFGGWRELARSAANSARNGDVESVRARCRGCHDQFRARFRSELRGTRLL